MGIFSLSRFPRTHSRDNKGTAQDVLLLLYLLNKAGDRISGKDVFYAKIKLLKLVFLCEKRMVDQKLKGFNFFFNIYTRGPSSKELLRMIDDLRERGLMKNDNNAFLLTESGKEMADDFEKSVEENTPFFAVVDEVLAEYGNLTTEQILEKVYAMEVKPMYKNETIKIGEAVKKSQRSRLLMSLDKGDVTRELMVPDSWVETINFAMNPDFA